MKYYTKCGRTFDRSSTAVVTGYHLTENPGDEITDPQCQSCPFVVDVKEGWPQVHKRFECRAGSQLPNHETTYRGRADDKCTMQIDSLDHEFLERIRAWCIKHPELGAAYNADNLADCRRSLSISCSQNRKGLAAKQELLDKFFPVVTEAPDPTEDPDDFDEEELDDMDLEDQLDTLLTDGDANDKRKPRTGANGCQEMREDCPCFCPHNDGCAMLLSTGTALKSVVTAFSGKVDCDVFRQVSGRIRAAKSLAAEEVDPARVKIAPVSPSPIPVGFDYSEFDAPIADALQQAESAIVRIKLHTVYDIGQQLSVAHDALAKAGSGSFGKWAESIGFSRDSAENYIRAYKFIADNFGRVEDAADIQPSLLFAASKPSAPPELSAAVITGDITKHKDYIKAMTDLKGAKELAERNRRLASDRYDQLTSERIRIEKAERKVSESADRIRGLENQLEHEKKRTGNPELNARITELSAELLAAKDAARSAQDANNEAGNTITQLQAENWELEAQLHDRPIETSAVEVREVLPESVDEAWVDGIESAIDLIARLTGDDLIRLIKIVGLDNYAVLKGDFRMSVDKAASSLDKLFDAITAAPIPAAAFIEWAKEDDAD